MSEAQKIADTLENLTIGTVEWTYITSPSLFRDAAALILAQASEIEQLSPIAKDRNRAQFDYVQMAMKYDQTVQELCEIKAKNAGRIAKLEEALAQIRDETRGCSQDMGFCRETGPLGCALGDQCVCMPVHMIARAALGGD